MVALFVLYDVSGVRKYPTPEGNLIHGVGVYWSTRVLRSICRWRVNKR